MTFHRNNLVTKYLLICLQHYGAVEISLHCTVLYRVAQKVKICILNYALFNSNPRIVHKVVSSVK